MTMTAAELVASKKHILLDFDGPICAAFAGYGAANISRQLAMLMVMEGADVPAELFDHPDPFEVLRHAATLENNDILSHVDAEFRLLELRAVQIAPQTTGAFDVVHALDAAGHTLTIVSNNSGEAVRNYAAQHGLDAAITGVSARATSDPSLLKPSPYLVSNALADLGGSSRDAVMIGDSPSDIHAARAAGVIAVGYVNKDSKTVKMREARPAALVTSMRELICTATPIVESSP